MKILTKVQNYLFENSYVLFFFVSILLLFFLKQNNFYNIFEQVYEISKFGLFDTICFLLFLLLYFCITAKIKLSDFPKSIKYVFLYSFVITAISLFLKYSTVPLSDSLNIFQKYNLYFFYFSLFCLIFSILRPGLIIFPICYVFSQHHNLSFYLDTYVTNLDYFTIFYLVLFLIFFTSLISLFDKNKLLKNKFKIDKHIINLLLFFGISYHFSIYFYSGIYKVLLGGFFDEPLLWLKENPTYILNGHAQISGYFNINEFFPYVNLNNFIIKNNFNINLFTLLFQLLCPLALINKRILMLFLLIFEVQHILIFFLTGIFFWKWIILNLVFFFSIKETQLKINVKHFIFLVTFLVCSNILFKIPKFAWLDTKNINEVKIYAITKDGKEFRIPSNFFLDKSVAFAQNLPGLTISEFSNTNDTSTYIWGSTSNKKIFKKIKNNCDDHLNIENIKGNNIAKISDIILKHHNHLKDKIFYYNLYPHHIWSSVSETKNFKKVSLRQITNYNIQIETYCLAFDKNAKYYKSNSKNKTFMLKIN